MAVVHTLRDADVAAVTEALTPLMGLAYPGEPDRLYRTLAAALEGDALAVVTVDSTGALLGFAALESGDDASLRLTSLWVAQRSRRRGIARAMLATFAKAWAGQTVFVDVPGHADLDVVAALLEQFAFKPVSSSGSRSFRTRRVRHTTGRASVVPLAS